MYRQIDRQCLHCNQPLTRQPYETWAIYGCDNCGGRWISRSDLASLLAHFHPEGAPDVILHNDGSERRPCVECGEPMDIAWIEFLKLDQCEAHGTWFDGGELKRVLENRTSPTAALDEVKAAEQARQQAKQQKRGGIAGAWAVLLGS